MQTRLQSLIEAWVNVAIGYFVALAAQLIVFPLYDIDVSMRQNIQIVLIFTAVSIARSYALRRLFNRAHKSKYNLEQRNKDITALRAQLDAGVISPKEYGIKCGSVLKNDQAP
jgi:hypothetical protein